MVFHFKYFTIFSNLFEKYTANNTVSFLEWVYHKWIYTNDGYIVEGARICGFTKIKINIELTLSQLELAFSEFFLKDFENVLNRTPEQEKEAELVADCFIQYCWKKRKQGIIKTLVNDLKMPDDKFVVMLLDVLLCLEDKERAIYKENR